MKVLVIYDIYPEETFMAMVDMTDEEYEYFENAHGVYVNATDNELAIEVANTIGNAFCDQPEYLKFCQTDKDREYFGKWKNDLTISDIKDADKLIRSGYYL